MSGIEAPGRRARREGFAAELTRALRSSGLTLEAVARRLESTGAKTSVATLSYWQNGQSMPTRKRSLEVVGSLEEVLDLPPGTLRRHLVEEARRFSPDMVGDGVLLRLAEQLDLPPRPHVQLLAVQDLLTLEADRQTGTTRVRQVLRLAGAEARVLTLAVADEPDFAPEMVAGHGCRVSRSAQDQAVGLTVAALELPRRLQRGDKFWYEYEIHWRPTGGDRDHSIRVLDDSAPIVTSDVVFRGQPPRTAGYRLQPVQEGHPGGEAPAAISDERLPVHAGRVQHVGVEAPAGEHVLHWAW